MKYLYFISIILILYLIYDHFNHKLSSSKAKMMISLEEIDYIIDVRTVEEWSQDIILIHIPMGTFPKEY